MIGKQQQLSLTRAWAAALCGRERWIIFATALATRLLQAFSPELPTDDTADYDEIALNLLSGEGFVARENWFGFEMHSWRAPAYPFALAAIYGVFGYNHLPALVAQAFVGAAVAVVVYDLGRQLHSSSAALAGGLAAVYEPMVRATSTLSTEPLYMLLMVSAVHRLVLETQSGAESGLSHGRRLRWLWCGAITGAATLTRPVGLLLWPVQVGLWAWRRARHGPGAAAWRYRSLWLSLGIVLVVAPWTLRNYHVHGALVPVSTHGGFIFARSNAAVPDWKKGERGWGIAREVFDAMPTETARDRYWLRQGIDYIRTHPAHYLRLVGERFLRFWYFFEPEYNFWFMSLMPFFAAGIAGYGRTDRFALVTALIGASLAVFCFILYASVRFRLALEPFFILYACAYIRDCWDRCGAVRVTGAVGFVLAVNGAIWWHGEGLRLALLGVLDGWNL